MRARESCESSQSVKHRHYLDVLLGCASVSLCKWLCQSFLSTKKIQANFYNPLIIWMYLIWGIDRYIFQFKLLMKEWVYKNILCGLDFFSGLNYIPMTVYSEVVGQY